MGDAITKLYTVSPKGNEERKEGGRGGEGLNTHVKGYAVPSIMNYFT